MFKILCSLKKKYKSKSRSKKPSLETIPENNVLYSNNNVEKNEVLNTVFMNEHWWIPNKKT